MDMPPLTSPDRKLNPVVWHMLLVLACVLVFSFALHAKLAVYGQAQLHPSTSSKLWLSGAKFEPAATMPTPALLWLAAFVTCWFGWHNGTRWVTAPVAVAREQSRRQYLHRFLRPPPAR